MKEKFVTGKAYLFGIATALGFILNRRSSKIPSMENGMFYPFQSYQDNEKYPLFLDFFNYVFDYHAQGSDEREKIKDIEKIADGGIEFLMEEYESQNLGHMDLSLLIGNIKESLGNQNSENSSN